MTAMVELERVSMVAPLGARFRDRASGVIVSSGLQAFVSPQGAPGRAVRGIENRSGTFAFFGIPGLREIEQGSGDATFWLTHPAALPFVLDVRDSLGRFLPLRTAVQLPVRGLMEVLLASGPSRRPPEGMAAVLADLHDADHDEPAAWAVMDVTWTDPATNDSTMATGFADAGGRMLLPMPWPPPELNNANSATPPLPLTQQTWPLTFVVRYRRRVPAPDVPDMVDVLSQPAMHTLRQLGSTDPLNTVTLSFGRELVLKTVGEPRSRLLITA